ncbi:SH3 domain-containing protein [Paracoccus sp. 1_MG-2023]|uniref:SH3 domain-containing protein n=1 Tax=unclassified Paracoccus (in: a-proteobacteria) TaxID=2688777 RepID=UPI001C0A61AD|nr:MULTISPECIES: SH3 domain-containing protein [unclassified Paracoccus (in: a-proteobacteria)]MBU2958203.1 SH3 domain-containing protein [Paracoccus sp. C2R09]MDO6668330.1 SH3 domain-containing protein [Paracoccus sp. 1_MG-2023]
MSMNLLRAGSLALGAFPFAALSQGLDVTFDTHCPPDAQAACFGRAEVMGLNPDGDGFLAVRSGPDASYPMLAKLTEGAVVGTYDKRGAWYAISFGPDNRLGWAHGNWLGNHIP